MEDTDKKSNFKILDSNLDNTESPVCIDSANIHALSSVELCDLLGWDFDVLTTVLCEFYSSNTSLQPKIIEDYVYVLCKVHVEHFLLHHHIPVKTQEKIQKYCNKKVKTKCFCQIFSKSSNKSRYEKHYKIRCCVWYGFLILLNLYKI